MSCMREALEGGGGVGEAEGHDCVLEVPIASTEGGLGDVLGVNANLVVTMAQVNLGENCGAVEAVEEFVHSREGVPILNGDVVKATVVDAKAEGPIPLADEQDGGAIG